MKKIISAVIGTIFVIVQAFLPLAEVALPLSHRITLALGLISIWILYTVFSDQIDNFICRSVFGRSLQKKGKDEKIKDFCEKIIPNTQILQKVTLCDKDNNFTKYYYYYNWCEIVDFIAMNCCKRDKYIDRTIIAIGCWRYANTFHRKVDISYLDSVIEVLSEFAKKNHMIISNNVDYLRYIKQLETVENIVKANLP